jgi:hypothetical protein
MHEKCPVCGYKYNLERTKIIDTKQTDQGNASLLVHSDCGQCKSSVVFSIAINGPELYQVGLITDLTTGDTDKFAEQQPISANDIFDMHQFLVKFDGDLVKALK